MYDLQPPLMTDREPTHLMEFFLIPVQIFENDNLTLTEMFLFSLIKMLDGKDHCFASNDYLANIMGVRSQKITEAISKFIKLGLVQEVSFDGRIRVIKINPEWEKNNRNLLLQFNERLKNFKKKTRSPQLDKPASSDDSGTPQMEHVDRSSRGREYNKIIRKNPLLSEEGTAPDAVGLQNKEKPKVDRTLLKQELPPVILPKPVAAGSVIGELIQYWEMLGLRKSMVGAKAYEDNVKALRRALRGTFFKDTHFESDYFGRKFTPEEIKLVMKRFSLAALDPDYSPALEYKKKMRGHSIASFLFTDMGTNGDQSQFIRFLKSSPEKASQSGKIKKVSAKYQDIINPLAEAYKEFYLRKVRKGMAIKVSAQDENNFLDGAVKLYNFIADNQTRLYSISDDLEIAKLACEAIWDWAKGDPAQVTSAKFKSDHTYSVLLPGKLVKAGIVDDAE
jgi:hypothetical protein